jgi:hypothetical protein
MKGGRKSCISTLPQVKARLTIPRGGQALTTPSGGQVTHDPQAASSYSQYAPGGGPHPGQGPPAAAGRYQAHPWQTGRPDYSQLRSSSADFKFRPIPGQLEARAKLAELRVKLAPARSNSGQARARAELKPVTGPCSGRGPGWAPGQASLRAPTWNWPPLVIVHWLSYLASCSATEGRQ